MEEHCQPKRQRLDKDVVVIVGGVEFQEYSHILCSISDYFNAAVQSGMKESKSMKFEFPDKNPEEWELVMSICAPFPKTGVNVDNWELVLPWFSLLCIPAGLEACDEFLENLIADKFDGSEWTIKYLSLSLEHGLSRCLASCLWTIESMSDDFPQRISLEAWISYWELSSRCEKLWEALFTRHLPAITAGIGKDELLKNALLPQLVYMHVQQKTCRLLIAQLAQELPESYHKSQIEALAEPSSNTGLGIFENQYCPSNFFFFSKRI